MNSKVAAVLGLAVVLMVGLQLRGCQEYGRVSVKTYEYAQAIYGACRRREDSRTTPRSNTFDTIRNQIQQSVTNEEMTSTEQAWLDEIMQTAEAGHVQDAMEQARVLLEEQVLGK